MRLKNKNRSNFVGPVCCFALLALITLGMICPQASSTYALGDFTNGTDCSYAASCNSTTTVDQKVTNTEAEKEAFTKDHTVEKDTSGGTSFVVVQDDKYDDDRDEKSSSLGWTVVKEDDIEASKSEVVSANLEYTVNGFIELTKVDEDLDVNIDIQPTISDGGFSTASTSFQVAGNNKDGFGIYVYAKDDDKLSLSSASADNTMTIDPISAESKQSDFNPNTWGYTVTAANDNVTADTTFHGLTTQAATDTPVYTYEQPTAGVALKLTCGAKVSAALPADTYSTQVVISAVAPFNTALIQSN